MALVTNEQSLRPVALKKVHVTNQVKYPPLLHEAATLLRIRGETLIFLTFLSEVSWHHHLLQLIVAFLRSMAGGAHNSLNTSR